MKIFLMILLAVASLILIASVLLQSGNSAGLSGSIAGGAEQLFGNTTAKEHSQLVAHFVAAVEHLVFVRDGKRVTQGTNSRTGSEGRTKQKGDEVQ